MSTFDVLWQPVAVGAMTLPNRLVMAPMTRNRATPSGAPAEMNARYYAQRASFGLIISEGTQPSDIGQGYPATPGVFTAEQIAGWKLVTSAVHAAGGRIVIQLMHAGRIAHPDNSHAHARPVGPSAVRAAGQMITGTGMQDLPEPRAMTADDLAATVRDFRRAAAGAIAAGADGVELHAANGYLLHQFISDNANQRTDAYGGSLENRVRFPIDVATAVAEEIGPERVGIRISPGNPFNDIVEGDLAARYGALLRGLAPLQLAYVHDAHTADDDVLRAIRAAWPGTLIVTRSGRPVDRIAADVAGGLADLAAVATYALANPDLVARLKSGAPLNEPDRATFYGGGEAGYTDYPTLDAPIAAR